MLTIVEGAYPASAEFALVNLFMQFHEVTRSCDPYLRLKLHMITEEFKITFVLELVFSLFEVASLSCGPSSQ